MRRGPIVVVSTMAGLGGVLAFHAVAAPKPFGQLLIGKSLSSAGAGPPSSAPGDRHRQRRHRQRRHRQRRHRQRRHRQRRHRQRRHRQRRHRQRRHRQRRHRQRRHRQRRHRQRRHRQRRHRQRRHRQRRHRQRRHRQRRHRQRRHRQRRHRQRRHRQRRHRQRGRPPARPSTTTMGSCPSPQPCRGRSSPTSPSHRLTTAEASVPSPLTSRLSRSSNRKPFKPRAPTSRECREQVTRARGSSNLCSPRLLSWGSNEAQPCRLHDTRRTRPTGTAWQLAHSTLGRPIPRALSTKMRGHAATFG